VLHSLYSSRKNDKIKKNEIIWGDNTGLKHFWLGRLKERERSEDLIVDETIILK
jgi:hypothetical protein